MNQPQFTYRSFVIMPMAAFDGGLYAAMAIVCDSTGLQRATGVLGHFATADEARAFALMAGKDEVDRRMWHSTAAA
ncbi:hypothetical protein AWB76_03747 [Caballeronia temeraria]|uniref:Uncharacterized protein n=1 Tax=Caballeronia temeraria TaxID=1777137 RepID=A0A158B7L0_9BURK|nr:hypothetical protein [Caballeronia temeraria]SAK65999.1 hypothetical protein AWB76_03747 [Caballeronia temeraria]